MKMKSSALAILVLLIIFGGIGLSSMAGIWSTTTSKIPAKYKDGAFAGSYNPSDIRGSYTFNDIAELFNIDKEILREAFNLPAETDLTVFKTKNLEEIYQNSPYEIGNGSMKVFVALYLNLPITLGDDYLTEKAVDIVKSHNKELTQEQLAYLDSHKIDDEEITDRDETTHQSEAPALPSENEKEVTEQPKVPEQPNIVPEKVDTVTPSSDKSSEEKEHSENLVTGKTTFKEVLDAGISEEQIVKILNAPMPPANQGIRDYCVKNNIPFSDIKNALNALKQ